MMRIWLGIAVRWLLLRLADRLIERLVLLGDPTVRQAMSRARRWGYRLELRLTEGPVR